jgi:hypothetical protein
MWLRPAGSGASLTGDAGGWTGYVKVRDDPTIESSKVKEQNQKFREAAQKCQGKDQAAFRSCMSNEL